MNTRRAIAGLLPALLASTAHAQVASAPTPAGAAPATTVEEVIVTAEKRETSLQRTPVSVQVYSGQQLAERGVATIEALAHIDTSLNIQVTSGQPAFAIRGVSSSDTSESGDPAVSIGRDGVFLNRSYGLFAAFYDLERIEVLRGPQGTLFGRNSTGGTINIITAKPKLGDFGGGGAVEVGNYDAVNASGYLNVPISDTLALRASFASRYHEGYRNLSDRDLHGDDEDSHSARLQLRYDPTSHLSLWVAGEYTKLGGVGPADENHPFVYPAGGGAEPVHQFPATLSTDGKTYDAHGVPFQDATIKDLKWSATYSDLLGDLTLSYLGGYNKIDYNRGFLLNFARNPGSSTIVLREQPDTLNQEVRLSSSNGGRFVWQIGAYYFREDNAAFTHLEFDYRSSAQTRGFLFDDPSVLAKSKAAFGQASFKITDTLKITGGARYTSDNKTREGSVTFFPSFTGAPFNISVPQTGSASSSKLTWLVGLDYQVTPANLLYAKISTGYKAGGYNTASSYGPEAVTSYELGSKNRFFDGRLQLNLAAFMMNYTNQQVKQFLPTDPAGGGVVNAGASRIYGIEANLVSVSDLGRFELSANYLHARFRRFVTVKGWDNSSNIDLSGNVLPLSPTFTAALSYEKEIPVAQAGYLTPRANLTYKSKQYFTAFNFVNMAQARYASVDLGLDFTSETRKWTVGLFARNLTDHRIFTQADELYSLGFYTYSYAPPRTYGARISVNF